MKHHAAGRAALYLSAVAIALSVGGCTYYSQLAFPSPTSVFMTSGDGNIQRPYTPIGEMVYLKRGFRIPLPVLGMIPIADVLPDTVLRTEVARRIVAMGGDGLINMRVHWMPPMPGLLGFMATGGSITVTGTVIRR